MIELAIVGPGNISHRFLAGSRFVKNAKVTAFVSRHPEGVREYAQKEGIEKVYTYAQFFNDDKITACYVCTPTTTHYTVVKDCLEHGKHVLCEKPMCFTTKETKALYALAKEKGLLLMEAQKALFVPVYTKVQELLDQNAIGKVRHAYGSFCRKAPYDLDGHCYKRELTFDIVCYPLSVLLSLFGLDVQECFMSESFEKGTAVSSSFLLKAKDETLLKAESSIAYEANNALILEGDFGRISVPDFWKGHDVYVETEKGKEHFHFDYPSDFTFEAQHFADLLAQGKLESDISTIDLSLKVCQVMEHI
jgi:predicted dehydrogenase